MAASLALLWVALVLTRFLRAVWPSTGGGVHGLTLVMSRGGGGGLHGGRLWVIHLENFGLYMESRAFFVYALPCSSYSVMA